MELCQVANFNHSSSYCPCFPSHRDYASRWGYPQLPLHIPICLGTPSSCPPCEGRHSPAFCLRLIPFLCSGSHPQLLHTQPMSPCILNPSLSTGTFSAFNTKVQVSPSYSQETTPSINPPTLMLSSYFLKDFSVLLASPFCTPSPGSAAWSLASAPTASLMLLSQKS